MKYLYLSIFCITLLFVGVGFAQAQTTSSGLNCTNGQCTYIPLEPLPVPGGAQAGNNFPLFVAGLFKVLLTFGGLFAVVLIVVAGIGYMMSESALDIDRAKERAKAALWGLLLLMGAWLILNTINPNILNFGLLNSSLSGLADNLPPSGAPAASTPTSGTASSLDPAKKDQCETGGGAYTAQPGNTYLCIYPSI